MLARRIGRRDTWRKELLSRLSYQVLSYLIEVPQDPAVANFGIYHRRVSAAVLAMRASIRYFPTMVRWVGFRTGYLDVTHAVLTEGRSSYGLGRRLHLGLDVLLANSDKLLRLTVKAGLLLLRVLFCSCPLL